MIQCINHAIIHHLACSLHERLPTVTRRIWVQALIRHIIIRIVSIIQCLGIWIIPGHLFPGFRTGPVLFVIHLIYAGRLWCNHNVEIVDNLLYTNLMNISCMKNNVIRWMNTNVLSPFSTCLSFRGFCLWSELIEALWSSSHMCAVPMFTLCIVIKHCGIGPLFMVRNGKCLRTSFCSLDLPNW